MDGLIKKLKKEIEKGYGKKFDQKTYNQRSTIESINSAIKRTLGSYVLARDASQQQKQVTIKALTYNIERMGRTIRISILMEIQ